MKREIFRRGTRMTHRFGSEEKDGPFVETFEPEFPKGISTQHSPPLTVQGRGEHRYMPAYSAVVKPGGQRASLEGPRPDVADAIAMPTPAGTKKRTPFKPT